MIESICIITAAIAISVIGVLLILMLKSPIGYEDEEGFHYGVKK